MVLREGERQLNSNIQDQVIQPLFNYIPSIERVTWH